MISRSRFLLALPALAATTRQVSAQTSSPLRIGAVLTEGFMEAWYAQDMGFFSDAGINTEITTFHNGADVSAALVGNAIDIGISSAISLANANLRGINFVYIAPGNIYLSSAPTIALCVAADSPIRTARDLEHKTIANVSIKDQLHLSALVWLAKNGADASSVKVIEVPGTGMLAVLEHGTIDGAIMVEPFFSAALAGGARVLAKCVDAISPRMMLGGWFTTSDWVRRNTTLARRFAAVIEHTGKWANARPPEATAILQKYTKLSDAVLQRVTHATFEESLEPATIDPMLTLAAKYKFTDRLVTARQLIATF